MYEYPIYLIFSGHPLFLDKILPLLAIKISLDASMEKFWIGFLSAATLLTFYHYFSIPLQVESFYTQCSPDRDNLCLYGQSDGTWEVALPCEEVPPELPEPALGVNFARDGMKRSDWLSLVAVHSDSWLMAVAFYNGARLDQEGRRQLFNDINSLPTCFEIVSGRASTKPVGVGAAQVNKRGSVGNNSGKRQRVGGSSRYKEEEEDEEEEEEEDGAGNGGDGDDCPNCGRQYRTGEFWIACDICDRWFDGKCVNMNQAKADRQPDWKCPGCVRGR
jgi:Alfin/PHD-finger